ncbi:MAG TPA: hypothetical protein VEZ11_03905 [Thermoanaerobaculia bacterium]|nr:hypothetical protein [Thermoanaerobaculia bacterium]
MNVKDFVIAHLVLFLRAGHHRLKTALRMSSPWSTIPVRSRRYRFAASTAIVLALFLGAAPSVRATLIVSDLSGGQIRLFDSITGNPIGTPANGGGEGVACVIGGAPALFVANNSAKISVYDPATLLPLGSGGVSIAGGSSVAALALSTDGSTLYAADYGVNQIFALSTSAIVAAATSSGTVSPLFSAPTGASHDVAVDPASGTVYTSHFSSGLGVLKFSPNLTPLGSFLSPALATSIGLAHPAGILVTSGTVWISNFSSVSCGTSPPATSCASVFKFNLSGSQIGPKIDIAPDSGPVGLALGPGDGNVYVANLFSNTVGKITVTTGFYSTFVSNAGAEPKYLQFTDNCTTLTNAFLEICKSSSLTNPVTGNFTFTATNGTFTSSPIVVPAGFCSGPIPVPSGTVKVTEAALAGVGVNAITAYGFNATTSLEENRLVSSDLANRIAILSVPTGNIASETIVDFTNSKIPTGVLEVCKDAAPGTTVTGSFSFNVSGAANNPYIVPVGACSGPILVQAGSVTVTEAPRAGFSLVDVETTPIDRLVSLNIPGGSAVVTVNAGDVTSETVVRFINGPATGTGQLKICKVAGAGVLLGQNFTITANGVSYTVPAGPAATGGYCVLDGTFPVGTNVTVQETPPAPYQVLNMTVNPSNRGVGAPIIVNGNGQATVSIGTGFTEVTVTNIGSTKTGQLKICKVAGPGVAVGTNFTFSVGSPATSGTTQTYTVPAGPPAEGGYCVVDGTFPVGTGLTVTEVPTPGFAVSGISVNGTSLPSGTPSASITINSGITEVAFTNAQSTIPNTPTALPFVSIVNYELVSQQAAPGGLLSATYRAALLNTGTALDSLTATLTSLDASQVQVAQGQDTLKFSLVPANSQITSSDTFTILTDPAAPADFSKLKWTLQAKGGTHRRRVAR